MKKLKVMVVVMTKAFLAFFFCLFNVCASCPLLNELPYNIEKKQHEETFTLLIFNLRDELFFRKTNLTLSENFMTYQKEIKHKTTTDWRELIKKQNIIFDQAGIDSKVSKMILNGQFGKVRKVNCLESLLFELHLSIQKKTHTEFLAMRFIKNKMTKIIFLSFNKASGFIPKDIKDFKNQLISKGWSYEFHLHNHPFNFYNPYGDIAGTIVPSSTDLIGAKKERSLQVTRLLISNGFHTFQYKKSPLN